MTRKDAQATAAASAGNGSGAVPLKAPRTPTAAEHDSDAKKKAAKPDMDGPITIGIVVPIAIVSAITWLWYNSYMTRRVDAPYADSSFAVPITVTALYIVGVFVGPKMMQNRAAFKLKNYMLVYNVYQTLLNIVMCYGFIANVIRLGGPFWGRTLDLTTRTYDLNFWIFVHYTNKYMELADTLFMILRKKNNQVSFLHVYHHALLIWAWFMVTKFGCGGDAFFGALANSFIHIIMYSYYAQTLLKIKVPYKKYITSAQLIQFVVCLAHACFVLYYNTYDRRLTSIQVWVMLNMLVLFLNFYDEQYNRNKVRWTVIDGKRYNITEFMKKHPGGSDMLMLAVGRDSTVMFHSYHRRLDVVKKYLDTLPLLTELPEKKLDGSKLCGKPDKFDQDGPTTGSYSVEKLNSPLYQAIRNRVNKYFEENKIPSRGGMMFKSLLLIAVTFTIWYFAIFHQLFWLCPLLGCCLAMNGLAIQHDANHGAFSFSPTINRLFGLCDDLIGGSAMMWKHQHVVAHHAHPNDVELDSDTFDQFPILRFNPQLPLRWYLRFQHIYAPFLYTLLGIAYPVGDLINYAKGRHEHVRLQPLRFIDKAMFFGGKLVHFTLMFGIPMYVLGVYAGFVYFYLPTLLMGGFFLASVFAVSHNSHVTEYNLPRDTDWAELQIRTSCNWGPRSKFWLYVSGGLNFQIEHHLFPGVAHIHYPAISKIIEDECKKRDIPYSSFDSYFSLYVSHFKTLYRLGRHKF